MKNKNLFRLFVFVSILVLIFTSCIGGEKKKTGPQVVTIDKKKQGPGDVWISPREQSVKAGSDFTNEIHVNTGNQKIAAFGLIIKYNNKVLSVNDSIGKSGAEEGPDGYLTAVNPNIAGEIKISGFDVYGKGPGEDLNIVRVNWKAKKKGESILQILVENLVDEQLQPVGTLAGYHAKVTVE